MTPKKYLTSTRIIVPGLRERVRLLHITDVHICRVDEDEPHAPIARERQKAMDGSALIEGRATELFAKLTARDFDAVLVTGDLMDFPSKASVQWVRALLAKCKAPLHYIGGNHDTQFPWSQNASAATRAVNLRLLAPLGKHQPQNLKRWEIKGLQFLAIDDSNYQIDAEQLDLARACLKVKGKAQPTVLALHIPLTQPRLREMTVRRWRDPILLGEPLNPEQRKKWAADPPSPETAAFLKLAQSAKNLRAILSGHVHFGHEEQYSETAMQLVGPPGYEGAFRIVEFAPAAS